MTPTLTKLIYTSASQWNENLWTRDVTSNNENEL